MMRNADSLLDQVMCNLLPELGPQLEGHSARTLALDEWRLNLAKDGGRTVMHCGDPYEDDVESVPGGGIDIGAGQ